jgi:hypothetical protein
VLRQMVSIPALIIGESLIEVFLSQEKSPFSTRSRADTSKNLLRTFLGRLEADSSASCQAELKMSCVLSSLPLGFHFLKCLGSLRYPRTGQTLVLERIARGVMRCCRIASLFC